MRVLEQCFLTWLIGELANAWAAHVLDQFGSLDCQPRQWRWHKREWYHAKVGFEAATVSHHIFTRMAIDTY
jgi:hypothetical protein